MERLLKPLNGYADMEWAIQKAGAWFIGSFMMEFVENYEKFQDTVTKEAFVEDFYNEYDIITADRHQLANRINLAIRIIESGMVRDAMKYVLNTNDKKLGCDESKANAQYLLDALETGEIKLPIFE